MWCYRVIESLGMDLVGSECLKIFYASDDSMLKLVILIMILHKFHTV